MTVSFCKATVTVCNGSGGRSTPPLAALELFSALHARTMGRPRRGHQDPGGQALARGVAAEDRRHRRTWTHSSHLVVPPAIDSSSAAEQNGWGQLLHGQAFVLLSPP